MDNVECGRERLNDIVEQEVRQEEEEIREKEEEQTEVNIDLIGRENEKVLKVAYRGFWCLAYQKQTLMIILIKSNHISKR